MAICEICRNEMLTGVSCIVTALHVQGRHVDLAAHRKGRGSRADGSCGDCGVSPGGFHHLGCDLQKCPTCGWQLISCGCPFDELSSDGDNAWDDSWDEDPGALSERSRVGGLVPIYAGDDVPEHDTTMMHGMKCRTALRSALDCAPELTTAELAYMVDDFRRRRLFTLAEVKARLAEPDMAKHPGAALLRKVLPPHAA